MASSNGIIAKRYARALFDSYEPKELDSIEATLKVIASSWQETEDLRLAMVNPTTPQSDKMEAMRAITGLAAEQDSGNDIEKLQNFAALLVENRRLDALPEISKAFSALVEDLKKQMALTVTSAFELSEEEKKEIEQAASNQLGTLVSVAWETDRELLGGLVVSVGDTVLDGSVRSSLDQIKNRLLSA